MYEGSERRVGDVSAEDGRGRGICTKKAEQRIRGIGAFVRK